MPSEGLSVVYDVGLQLFRHVILRANGLENEDPATNTTTSASSSATDAVAARTQSTDGMAQRIARVILTHVERERLGELTDHSLLRSAIDMFLAVGSKAAPMDAYREDFEAPFLRATRAFYDAEARTQLQDDDIPSYLLYIERRLKEERERVGYYLSSSTMQKLQNVCQEALIKNHHQRLIHVGPRVCDRHDADSPRSL